MGRDLTVAVHRAGMTAGLFKTHKKVPTADLWNSINGLGTKEPLCDRLEPNKKVVDALSYQGLACKGLTTKFLHSMGNTTVHLVPYHEDQPEIAPGFQRAECGAYENGWYATVNIRTVDEEPDLRFIRQLGRDTGLPVSVTGGRQGSVLVTLSCIVATETSIYTVSLIDTELLKLRTGREMVNRVACELFVSKEIPAPGLTRIGHTTELFSALLETG